MTFLVGQVAVLWDERGSVEFLFQPGRRPASCLIDLFGCTGCCTLRRAWLSGVLFHPSIGQLHASLTFLAAQVAVLWDERGSVEFLFQPGDGQLHASLTFLVVAVSPWWQPAACFIDLSGCSCFNLVAASCMPHWPFWLFLFQPGGSQLHASLTFLAAQVAVLWDEHSSVDFLFLVVPVSPWWQPASCLIDLSGCPGCPTLRRARRRGRTWPSLWSVCWTWWWPGWSGAWTSPSCLPPETGSTATPRSGVTAGTSVPTVPAPAETEAAYLEWRSRVPSINLCSCFGVGEGGEGMGRGGKEWGGWEGGTRGWGGGGGVSAGEMLKCSCIHCHRYKMVW